MNLICVFEKIFFLKDINFLNKSQYLNKLIIDY